MSLPNNHARFVALNTEKNTEKHRKNTEKGLLTNIRKTHEPSEQSRKICGSQQSLCSGGPRLSMYYVYNHKFMCFGIHIKFLDYQNYSLNFQLSTNVLLHHGLNLSLPVY